MKHTLKTKGKSLKLTTLGFTLIELLAVIVILAIIALIATPIVLNIIDDTKENAILRSAEMYLDAVEQAIMRENMNKGGSFKPSICEIDDDGNLICDGNINDEVKIEVSGEKPTDGEIFFQNGTIKNIQMTISGRTIENDDKSQLVFVNSKYYIGQPIEFNPGDQLRKWYVIGEDADTVTLILERNLVESAEWMSFEDYFGTNTFTERVFIEPNKGPVTVLNVLNRLTEGWTNIEPIKNYEYINNKDGIESKSGYQKLSIINGETTITNLDGSTKKITGETKARLSSNNELKDIEVKSIKESDLKAYIERNLEKIKTKFEQLALAEYSIEFNSQATTPNELILELDEFNLWIETASIYTKMYRIVETSIELGIESDYNLHAITLLLYGNLDEDENTDISKGFWLMDSYEDDVNTFAGIATLSRINSHTNSEGSTLSWYTPDFNGTFHIVDKYGIRPVITVQKSKLK